MSEEHKALGYRPPPGSLAAEAQASAAKRPGAAPCGIPAELIRQAALADAERIKLERETQNGNGNGSAHVDLSKIGEGEQISSSLTLRS